MFVVWARRDAVTEVGNLTVKEKNYRISLVRELLKMDREATWVELKHNNSDPNEIGEYISALSNSAALEGRPFGYVVWGVDDSSHDPLCQQS